MTVDYDLSKQNTRDLMARLRVLHAGRRHLVGITEPARRLLRSRKVITDFLVAAHSLPRSGPDDADVSWLADQWRALLCGTRQLQTRDERPRSSFDQVLDDMTECLADLSSAECACRALSAPRPCKLERSHQGATGTASRWSVGPPSDRQAVDPLAQLFGEICRHCAKLYPAWQEPQLVVKAILVNPAAPTAADPYSFTASTEVDPKDGRIRVNLKICLRDFGPESFAALPRVLVHECVAHVPSGHAHTDSDAQSVFAEGWMDFAAEYYFRRWMSEIDDQLERAALHHGRLMSEVMPLRGTEGPARTEGHVSAAKLSAWFEQYGPEGCGDRMVARLAVKINASAKSLDEKTALARQVLGGVSDPLSEALLSWAKTTDSTVDAILETVSTTT